MTINNNKTWKILSWELVIASHQNPSYIGGWKVTEENLVSTKPSAIFWQLLKKFSKVFPQNKRFGASKKGFQGFSWHTALFTGLSVLVGTLVVTYIWLFSGQIFSNSNSKKNSDWKIITSWYFLFLPRPPCFTEVIISI